MSEPNFMTPDPEFNRKLVIYELPIQKSFEEFPRAVRTVILDRESNALYVSYRISDKPSIEKIRKEFQTISARNHNLPCHTLIVDDRLELYVDVAWLSHVLPEHAHYYSAIEGMFRERIAGRKPH